MTISPVLDIQARIASIQQTISARVAPSGGAVGGVLGASALTTGAASTASAGTFADDLSRATALQGGDAASSLSPVSSMGSSTQGTLAGSKAVETAKEYLGVPYVWGGKSAATGLDCSGLTSLVYARLGVELPAGSAQQVQAGQPVAGLTEARPGDLLFFGKPTDHVAIYAGDGKMVHAPRTGKAVEVSSVYETPTDIRRVLPEASGLQSAAPIGAPAALAKYAGPLPAATPYATEFRNAEAKTGVPARVLAAVARAESAFRPDAVSSAGARGLMQFMPATARGLGVDPMNPASAIEGAAKLLKRHVAEFGSLELSLAAYNAGQGSVRKYGGVPPYAETQQYVQKILTTLNGRTS